MKKQLYKKDSKLKIRIWEIEASGDCLIQRSGLYQGKLVSSTKLCTPKNVGKSNETTGTQQALLELESTYKSKLDEGYFPSINEANTEKVILPMLAKSYNDEKHKIDWNSAYIQPKLDGMRCLAFCNNGVVKLMSRQGKEITTVPHIVKELQSIKDNIILDGELYLHGVGFQENMKLLKKYRKGETEQIKYHVYDCVSEDNFNNRYLLTKVVSNLEHCKRVFTTVVKDEKQLEKFHSINLNDEYEGSIIRWGDAPYKINGRSENLLKYKDFQDIALPIIDITPNDANPLHGTPWFEINNKKFKAGCKLSHEDREDLLKNKGKYIGKTGEIRFFEYSDEGTPRFPVYLGLRLDK